MLGKIIGGNFENLIVRLKSDVEVEIGQLVVTRKKDKTIIYQVIDIFFGSQISSQNLELISGIEIEESESNTEIFESNLRNYILAKIKPILTIKENSCTPSKTISSMFDNVFEINEDDLKFLQEPKHKILFGELRNGSKVLKQPVYLNAKDVFSHHVLVSATTGKGKSVLLKNLLWNSLEEDSVAHLIFDPHDEYYGRNELGLKDHTKDKISYYTTNETRDSNTLVINLSEMRPGHFQGVSSFSDAQWQALNAYNKEYHDYWIEAAIMQKPFKNAKFDESTLNVISRKMQSLLDIKIKNDNLMFEGPFHNKLGESTIVNIKKSLKESKTVIVDTSNFSGSQEVLISSIITQNVYNEYKYLKKKGELDKYPIISIVLEEAPRVIGKDVLAKGQNVFGSIAREGRKFGIGLIAITQLPSLIPREILANINTKIILGMEMAPERNAIIDSSAQDLSSDSKQIASLDKGEAIITSTFTKFAVPIKIPFFDKVVKEELKNKKDDNTNISYSGINLV